MRRLADVCTGKTGCAGVPSDEDIDDVVRKCTAINNLETLATLKVVNADKMQLFDDEGVPFESPSSAHNDTITWSCTRHQRILQLSLQSPRVLQVALIWAIALYGPNDVNEILIGRNDISGKSTAAISQLLRYRCAH